MTTTTARLAEALWDVLNSDVGQQVIHKLLDGQGTETNDCRAWLAAREALAAHRAGEKSDHSGDGNKMVVAGEKAEPVAVVESIGPVPGMRFDQPRLLWYVDLPNIAAKVKVGDKLYAGQPPASDREPLIETCEWHQDDEEGTWLSACGGDPWRFEADDPTKNGMRFCTHCGKCMKQRTAITAQGTGHQLGSTRKGDRLMDILYYLALAAPVVAVEEKGVTPEQLRTLQRGLITGKIIPTPAEPLTDNKTAEAWIHKQNLTRVRWTPDDIWFEITPAELAVAVNELASRAVAQRGLKL